MKFRITFLIFFVMFFSGCAQVAVNQVAEDEFKLEQVRSEAIKDFRSSALKSKAEKLCPSGYSYLLRYAEANSLLAKHQAECMTGSACDYTLHWHIKCGDIPREKRSIFGKT